MNTVEIKKNSQGKLRIFLQVDDPADWPIAEHLTGSVVSERPGVFEYALGALNFQRIYSIFTGPKRPILRGGSFFMDKERENLASYNRATARVVELNRTDWHPVEPNGKFNPRAHQTLAISVLKENPFSPIILDCGTGKTASTARAIELALERGEVMRGKILVSVPLSIIKTSWIQDIEQFTNLKPCVLRAKESNKDILGSEEVQLHDLGPKPADAVTVKKKTKVFFRNAAGDIATELNTITKALGPWTKFKAKVQVGINLNGEEKPFGPVMGRTVRKEETKKNKIREMLQDPAYDLFIINHDGVKNYRELLKAHEFAWVVIDESTKVKNPSSDNFSAHVDISWKCKKRTILTGTPNPNGLIDLWGQFYFLDRGLTLEASMKDFLSEYFTPIRVGHFGGKDAIEWKIRSNADRDRLLARVKRTGVFKNQRDCIDLPPRTDLIREVCMTKEQQDAYLEMEHELIAEFTDARTAQQVRAEAVNTLSKLMKLRQITSGFMVGEEGIKGVFKTNPKLEDLDDFLEDFGDNKLVLSCQFTEEINTVLERYKHYGITHIDGRVKVEHRDERVTDFQRTDKYKIMVLQPAAAAHGLTLTASSYLFFLSFDYNFEYYYQVAKRIERLGQKNNIFVIHSLATLIDGGETIDHDLFAVVKEKEKGRDILFRAEVDVPGLVQDLTDRLIKKGKSRL